MESELLFRDNVSFDYSENYKEGDVRFLTICILVLLWCGECSAQKYWRNPGHNSMYRGSAYYGRGVIYPGYRYTRLQGYPMFWYPVPQYYAPQPQTRIWYDGLRTRVERAR